MAWATDCLFCGRPESTKHLFVDCSYIRQVWDWIFAYNGFTFTCSTISDLWLLDSTISFKNRLLVELLRGAVIWTVWLKHNQVCFKGSTRASAKTLGTRIISSTSFWCESRGDDSYLNLSLILPSDVKELLDPFQAAEEVNQDLTTAVEILVSLAWRRWRGYGTWTNFLDLLREDFGPDNPLSPTSGDALSDEDDDVDWVLLDY